MISFKRHALLTLVLSTSLLLFSGCGGSQDNSSADNSGQSTPAASPAQKNDQGADQKNLTTASITPSNSEEKPKEITDPLLLKLRDVKALSRQPFPETEDPKKLSEIKLNRYKQIINDIIPVIAKTVRDPEREAIFVESIRTMIDARLKAALLGDEEEIAALYADAESMYENSKKSPAAAKAAPEAGLAVVRFAHAIARVNSKKIPEFTKQARLYATRFPEKKLFTVPLLYSAAWSAELHQMRDEAIHCYTLIRDDFPDTPQAAQSTAILRRLSLTGKSAQLSGPTIDGGLWNLDDQKGKVVLVVFWDSKTETFQEMVPELVSLSKKYEKYGLHTVGVNLDKQEGDAYEVIDNQELAWPQVFFPEQDKRRWNNPMVVYYGIRDIPLLWLIDHNGIVQSTDVKMDSLKKEVETLLLELKKSK